MRERWFPPALNKVPAHLTLFHHLPGHEERRIVETVANAAPAPFCLTVAGPMKLGRGVALRIESPALLDLRAELARAFKPWLTRQDREPFRPHVTIQNKARREEARGLYDHLERTFAPFAATAEGVQLWRYLGGPWAPLGAVAFPPAPRLD